MDTPPLPARPRARRARAHREPARPRQPRPRFDYGRPLVPATPHRGRRLLALPTRLSSAVRRSGGRRHLAPHAGTAQRAVLRRGRLGAGAWATDDGDVLSRALGAAAARGREEGRRVFFFFKQKTAYEI